MSRPVEPEVELERLFLVFVNEDEDEDEYVEEELAGLCEASGGEPVGSTRQRISKPHRATYIGSGKVEEIALAAEETNAEVVVIDAELSGVQLRNLDEQIKARVVDRTQLILDIFARRAQTKEGKLQVELAQLTYMLPRLMSVYTKFERQRGGIGMRGPGETKLESDRRMVNQRIAKLKSEIDDVKRHRVLQRESRRKLPFPTVAIVGYTSAGKSTLMNRLADADVLADAMPFATLDPTTRKIERADGFSFFAIDTVGFVRKLPTHLVAAFRATLEEAVHADLLLHVIDVSNPDWDIQRDAVLETLDQLGAQEVPMLTVFNKIDALINPSEATTLVAEWDDSVAISAEKGDGIDDLLDMIVKMSKGDRAVVEALVPYDQTALVESCYRLGRVLESEYRDDGVYIRAEVVPEMQGKLAPYVVQ